MTSSLDALQLRARFEWWAPLRSGRFPSFHDSHSQFGEDMVVRGLVGDRAIGTFVDIGAHHPVYLSNTYHFYRKGWRGLNIDALPGSMDPFRVLRPEDINVEACIAPTSGETRTLYIFEDMALTTTDANVAEEQQAHGRKLRETHVVQCLTLTEALDRYLGERPIDLVSLDIEGLEEAILRGHDWDTRRPGILIFERHGLTLNDATTDSLVTFLSGHDYVLEAKCGPSLIMRDKSLNR
jgi:FkbM family methyltransferase